MTNTFEEIAQALNRTVMSVRRKAVRSRLPKSFVSRQRLMHTPLPPMTDIQVGYLAGLMDGEGSISIIRPNRYDRETFRLQPQAMISGTDPMLAEYLQTTLDAKVLTRIRPMKNSRPTWQVGWYGFRCYPIVKLVEPHLLIKRDQAQIVIEFLESRINHDTYNQGYTEHEMALYERIRGLNRHGLSGWKYEHHLSSSTT